MLRRLRIQNFKAWQDTGNVRLAPLTVLFGPNSSGKSSINQFLMLLRQTMQSADRNSVFDFGDASSPVRLGSFRDIVYAHDTERTVQIALKWRPPQAFGVRDPRSGRRYWGRDLRFAGAARLPDGSGRIPQSEGFEYQVWNRGEKRLGVGLRRDEKRASRWRLVSDEYDLVRNPGRAWELPKPIQFHSFPKEAALYYQNTGFLLDFELELEDQIDQLVYLGPLRVPPERMYSWSGGIPENVGWRGEKTVQAILASSGRGFNWTAKARRTPFQAVIAHWLKQMRLIDDFAVTPIAPEHGLYEVRVRTASNGQEVTLTDVGFGVSQVLPVIVQAFYAQRDATVLMEQPEIHLHPAVQASLADLFISALSAREEGYERNVQFIIESHSEHFLRRLQRRVAEEEILPSDIALYFCSPGPDGSTIERLGVDEYGDVANWPRDFFGDELEDLAVQAQRAAQRRLKGQGGS